LESAVVAALNSFGLLILGIEYAILIGVIGALLNLIPYIGGLVAISIPMLVAIATKSPADALWVFVLYMLVQEFDNNFIVPKIVASRVKINALASIVVVLIGGAMWGVAGMFLSIPLTAIVKVIFDRITPLKPFGFLLGDNQHEIVKFRLRLPEKNADLNSSM
jgi:predicted PurR-regulated permease PerM